MSESIPLADLQRASKVANHALDEPTKKDYDEARDLLRKVLWELQRMTESRKVYLDRVKVSERKASGYQDEIDVLRRRIKELEGEPRVEKPLHDLLSLVINQGGSIVSTNDLSEYEIAEARACDRMAVTENGFGYVYYPPKPSDPPAAD